MGVVGSPAPPSRLGKFAKTSEMEEDTSAMEEDQEEGEVANTYPPQKSSGHRYLDHGHPHNWSKIESEADEVGYKIDRQEDEEEEDNSTTERSSFLVDSQEMLEDEEELPQEYMSTDQEDSFSVSQEEPTSTQQELTSKWIKEPTSTQESKLPKEAEVATEGQERGVAMVDEEMPMHSQDHVDIHALQDMGRID